MFGWLFYVNVTLQPQETALQSLEVVEEPIDPSQVEYLNSINFYREKLNIHPLKSGRHLQEPAERRACEVDANTKRDKGILTHTGFREFARSLEYQGRLAENLSYGVSNVNVIERWYLSWGHHLLMTADKFNYVWVATCKDTSVMLLN